MNKVDWKTLPIAPKLDQIMGVLQTPLYSSPPIVPVLLVDDGYEGEIRGQRITSLAMTATGWPLGEIILHDRRFIIGGPKSNGSGIQPADVDDLLRVVHEM